MAVICGGGCQGAYYLQGSVARAMRAGMLVHGATRPLRSTRSMTASALSRTRALRASPASRTPPSLGTVSVARLSTRSQCSFSGNKACSRLKHTYSAYKPKHNAAPGHELPLWHNADMAHAVAEALVKEAAIYLQDAAAQGQAVLLAILGGKHLITLAFASLALLLALPLLRTILLHQRQPLLILPQQLCQVVQCADLEWNWR